MEEDLELILQAKVDDIILGDAIALQSAGKVFVGLQSIFDILEFPIEVNRENKSAKGWFIKENYLFQLSDQNTRDAFVSISVKGKKSSINKSHFRFADDDIYLDANTLFGLLEIEYEFSFNDLSLKLIPKELLPVQLRLARKNKKPNAGQHDLIAQYPRVYRPYRLWSLPFMDVQTLFNTQKHGQNAMSYSALGGGDLAYMTGTYFLSGNKDQALKHFRLTLSKDSIKNDLLGHLKATHYSMGDITTSPNGGLGNSGQEVGFRISNRAKGKIINLNKTDFTGDAQPGWDVELYRNNHLIASQTVGESGRYEFFDQELLYGENIFTLVFYGPQGQHEEITEHVNLNADNLSLRDIEYDMSLTRQDSRLFYINGQQPRTQNEHRRFNFNIKKSIGKFLSLQTTYTQYTFSDETKHQFIQPAAKFFLFKTLLNTTYTKDLNGGHSLYSSLSRGLGKHSFSMSQTHNSADFATNSGQTASVLLSNQFSLAGPLFSTRFIKLNYSTESIFSQLKDDYRVNKYSAKLAAKIGRISLGHNANYSESRYEHGEAARSLDGSLHFNTYFNKFSFRGAASYALEPSRNIALKQITGLNGNITWLTTAKLKTNYSYKYSPSTDFATHSLAFSWRAKYFNLISNINYSNNSAYTAFIGINFSLGYDRKSSNFGIGPERIAKTGAIAAKIFTDDNNNGQYDENEQLLAGAKLQAIQARKIAESGKNGKLFLPGLPTDRVTDVVLDSESMNDPFLVSVKPSFSLLPRPGLVESIEIPVVTSGEVEGTIYLETIKTGHVREAGYVPLVLQNIKTRDKYHTSSAYDGFYLFSQVPPGKYLVSVDRRYLMKEGVKARKPMPRVINIEGDGSVVMGADFTLYSD